MKETEIRKGIALAREYSEMFRSGKYSEARAVLKKASKGSLQAHETFTECVLRYSTKVRGSERKL